jgi:hypothetical protein
MKSMLIAFFRPLNACVLAALLVPITSCEKSQPQQPPKWQYVTFQWHDYEFDQINHPNEICTTVIKWHGGVEEQTEPDGRDMVSLEMLLQTIGRRGWEISSVDGNTYIAKRSYTGEPGKDFEVIRRWETVKPAN